MLARKPQNLSTNPVAVFHHLLALCLVSGLAFVATAVNAAWTVGIKPDPLTRQPRCLLSSEIKTISDGYEPTPISLVFNGDSLLAITESELDASFADLQLTVDNYPPFRSDKIERHIILSFDKDTAALLRRLREGHEAVLYLRFWPTWPVTQLFPIHFSLTGFSKAHDAFVQGCRPLADSNPPLH